MITVAQLKEKSKRKYWNVLRAILQDSTLFPLTIPADKKLPESYEAMRRAVGRLVENSKDKKGSGYRVEFCERKTRRFGIQTLPTRIYFETVTDYFIFIGRKGEAQRIIDRAEGLKAGHPELTEWVGQNPQKMQKYLDQWESLTRVLHYFREHPRPGLYIRELPIKVHTKFVEQHKAILRELLEYIIPEHVDHEGETFERRFHLKSPEVLIRIRRLDPKGDPDIFCLSDDITLPIGAFNRLEPRARNVVITENQMAFLTLPAMTNSIAVYGGGFMVEVLKEAGWLKTKNILYWGDIDVHGFLILSLVRRYFPLTVSIMMNEDTFFRFRERCGEGADVVTREDIVLNLTPGELKLFRIISAGNYRLEQEQLSQEYIDAQFEKFQAALND
ncbi:MAG: hypothetical protein GY757_30135 [bacterium]|nr:hypothetical protein [bacterium]